ncbi:Importin-11, partial [Homalodisca vitripennis]
RSTKEPVTTQVERCIIKLTKVLLSLLENHPLSFVDSLPETLTFTVHYAFTPEGEPLLFERFLIQCLNLLKGILLCPEYKPAKIIEETKEPDTLRAHQIKITFFETTILNAMCRKLITQYFLLTPQDLQQWDTDPEGFDTFPMWPPAKFTVKYNQQELNRFNIISLEHWSALNEEKPSYMLAKLSSALPRDMDTDKCQEHPEKMAPSRASQWPCTETLFLALFHEFRETLTPLLLQLITQIHGPVDPHDLPAILAKDAVYNAVGIAAFDLYDEIISSVVSYWLLQSRNSLTVYMDLPRSHVVNAVFKFLDGSSSHATYRWVALPRILLQWEWQLLLIGQTLSRGRGPAPFTKSLTGAPVKASSQMFSESKKHNSSPARPSYRLPSDKKVQSPRDNSGLRETRGMSVVNFDEWFTTTLQAELQIRAGNYRVVRRRITDKLGSSRRHDDELRSQKRSALKFPSK